MLQQDRGGERVDVPLSPARRTAHFPYRALGGGRREALVYQTNGKSTSFSYQAGDPASFSAPLGVLARLVLPLEPANV